MKKVLCLLFTIIFTVSIFVGCCSREHISDDISTIERLETASTTLEVNSTEQLEPSTVDMYVSTTCGTIPYAELTTVPAQIETTNCKDVQPFDLSIIPPYSGQAYCVINNNIPYFTEFEITANSFEQYAPLDLLGRCGVTVASIGPDLMPTVERGSIGMVKPTGWHTVKYDCIDGNYLYNRCHLIGYQLTGENANTSNLITGTRYLNIEGMLPFENMVADYIKETGNHVMYRSTPIFEGENLLSKGVLIEGWSVEDCGDGICFCIFAYNVQPGVFIDYSNGKSTLEGIYSKTEATTTDVQEVEENNSKLGEYILNKNTKKFHFPSCSSVGRMKEKNKEYYTGLREDLIAAGYEPCKNCNP